MFIFLMLLFPMHAFAAGVGFVPSTGLWFSTTSFVPNQTVRVYSVVMNNDYNLLDGSVGFYDNNELFDTVTFQGLPHESAQEIKAAWQPAEGQHTLSARFISATAHDASGTVHQLDVSQINAFTGAPLTVGNGSVAPTTVTVSNPSDAATNSTVPPQGSTQVLVQQGSGGLLLAALPSSVSLSQNTAGSVVDSATDVFQKNREILNKAEQVAATITTTAGTVEKVYTQTKSVVDQGRAYYGQAQVYWSKVQPYIDKAKPFWDTVTNNSEPKRVAYVVGGAVLILLVLRWRIRQMRQERYERYGGRR